MMDSLMIASFIGAGFSFACGLVVGSTLGRKLRLGRIRRLRAERDENLALAEWMIDRRLEDQRYYLALNRALSDRANRAEKAIAEADMVLVGSWDGEVRLLYRTEAPQF